MEIVMFIGFHWFLKTKRLGHEQIALPKPQYPSLSLKSQVVPIQIQLQVCHFQLVLRNVCLANPKNSCLPSPWKGSIKKISEVRARISEPTEGLQFSKKKCRFVKELAELQLDGFLGENPQNFETHMFNFVSREICSEKPGKRRV